MDFFTGIRGGKLLRPTSKTILADVIERPEVADRDTGTLTDDNPDD